LRHYFGDEAFAALKLRPDPKIGGEEVAGVLERIRRGGTIRAEAIRIGCDYKVVRKVVRRALGVEVYSQLFRGRSPVSPKVSKQEALEAFERVKAGSSVTAESHRLDVHGNSLRRAIYRAVGKGVALVVTEPIRRRPRKKVEGSTDKSPRNDDPGPDPSKEAPQGCKVAVKRRETPKRRVQRMAKEPTPRSVPKQEAPPVLQMVSDDELQELVGDALSDDYRYETKVGKLSTDDLLAIAQRIESGDDASSLENIGRTFGTVGAVELKRKLVALLGERRYQDLIITRIRNRRGKSSRSGELVEQPPTERKKRCLPQHWIT
jgi:hypothetical protein